MEAKKSAYYTKLSGDVKKRYDEKISQCNGIDPYTLTANDLSVDRNDFPNISVSDIGDYMICSISPFTHQSNNAYKSTEAYRYFDSGFVLNIGSKTINSTAILIGKVKHSQKMNDDPHEVWVLASMDGKIVCAHCTCLAGLSETCSHVGAICYTVSNIFESSEKKSVTELLCKWNVPSFKNVSMKPATDIDWKLPSQRTTRNESSFLSYCDTIAPFTDDRITEFIKKCNSDNDETALETILFPLERKRKTNLRDQVFLASLYSENNRNKSLNKLVAMGTYMFLNLSDKEVQEICRITKAHLKSKFYVGLQRGRITGSNLKNCCEASIIDPCIATINRIIKPTKLDNGPSMKYHNRNRKKAIHHYLQMTAPDHVDFQYAPSGLIINQKFPYFAASPDGLVNCDCHGHGCIVVKCLKILSTGASLEVLTSQPNNILNNFKNEYSIEKTHEFFYQIQLQIHLVELEYCDFIIYSPHEFLPLRIYPDIDFWMAAFEKASSFHKRVIMPELLGKFYTTNAVVTNSKEELNDGETAEKLELVALKIQILD